MYVSMQGVNFLMESSRNAAYNQFGLWHYGKLGREQASHSCLCSEVICQVYPAPDGQYIGFWKIASPEKVPFLVMLTFLTALVLTSWYKDSATAGIMPSPYCLHSCIYPSKPQNLWLSILPAWANVCKVGRIYSLASLNQRKISIL